MDFQFAYLIGIFGIIAVVIRIIISLYSNPGGSLNKKFVAIGSLTGKTKAEIISRVGPISSQTMNPDNSFICTWAAGNYAISVLFGPDGRAQKIIHEKLQ